MLLLFLFLFLLFEDNDVLNIIGENFVVVDDVNTDDDFNGALNVVNNIDDGDDDDDIGAFEFR